MCPKEQTEGFTAGEWGDLVLESRRVSIDDILFNPDNFRIHSQSQKEAILPQISRGWARHAIVNLRSSPKWGDSRGVQTLVDGHMRVQLAASKGQTTVPVDFVDLEPDDEATLLATLDNVTSMAGIDREKLSLLIKKSKQDEGTQNALLAIAKKTKVDKLQTDALKNLDQVSGEIPGVRTLRDQVHFPSDLEYGLPELRSDLILEVPDNLQVWVGPNHDYKNPDYFLYMWGSDSIKGMDLTKTVVGFYVDDWRFDKFWSEAAEYTGKLLNAQVLGAIVPNFTVSPFDPLVVRLWQRYRALWVGRYFQEAGIRIVPDVPLWGSAEDNEMLIVGVPKGVPISIQAHTKRAMDAEVFAREIGKTWSMPRNIEWVIDQLDPPQVLIYADEKGWNTLTDSLYNSPALSRLRWIKDRVGVRRAYMDAVAAQKL